MTVDVSSKGWTIFIVITTLILIIFTAYLVKMGYVNEQMLVNMMD
jgi:hypothetical protein